MAKEKRRFWTEAEDQMLIQAWKPIKTYYDARQKRVGRTLVGRLQGRTWSAIQNRAAKLKIQPTKKYER